MMNTKKPLTLLLFLLFLVAPGVSRSQEVINKNFTGIEKLELQVGGIEVNYQGVKGKTDITLDALLGEGETAKNTLVMVTIGNTLKIGYSPSKNTNNYRSKRFIHLTGPENISLNLNNSSGALIISDVYADLTTLRIGSGLLRAKNIVGEVEVKGTSGKINLKNIQGKVTCSMTSGIAEIEDINGNLDFKATSGMFKGKDIKGILNTKLTSGNIRIENVEELGVMEVTSGNIKAFSAGLGENTWIKGASGNIDISTASRLEDFNYEMKAGSGMLRVGDQSRSKLLVIENGPYPTIKGNIGSGSIQIKNL
jgi:lia operon protein LiaG